MKRLAALLLTLALLISPALADEEKPVPGNMILLTTYVNFAWGSVFKLAVLDENGVLWRCVKPPKDALPDDPAEAARLLAEKGLLDYVGRISLDRLRDIKSMVETLQEQTVTFRLAACDAGKQQSYALKRDDSGHAACILLGAAGDEVYEHNDPSAQALYRFLREAFPNLEAFQNTPGLSPEGFTAQDLRAFCGHEGIDLRTLAMAAYRNDCEEGIKECEPQLSAQALMRMKVTGKRNSLRATGNTVSYVFKDENGKAAASFEFCDGLLVMPDGMYEVE